MVEDQTRKKKRTYHIVRTTAYPNNRILQDLKLDEIARPTTPQILQSHVRGILEYVKRIHRRRLEITPHSPRFHRLRNILRATPMSFQTLLSIKSGIASHEGHVMRMANIGGKLEDRFLLVSDEAVPNGWRCAAVECVACVGHGEMFETGRVREYPRHHIHDLLAMDVDYAE
ncbi:MAG: hypothetical protein Q9208_004719 [Pyrenodesmia sp. 3 TL-2023]